MDAHLPQRENVLWKHAYDLTTLAVSLPLYLQNHMGLVWYHNRVCFCLLSCRKLKGNPSLPVVWFFFAQSSQIPLNSLLRSRVTTTSRACFLPLKRGHNLHLVFKLDILVLNSWPTRIWIRIKHKRTILRCQFLNLWFKSCPTVCGTTGNLLHSGLVQSTHFSCWKHLTSVIFHLWSHLLDFTASPCDGPTGGEYGEYWVCSKPLLLQAYRVHAVKRGLTVENVHSLMQEGKWRLKDSSWEVYLKE